MLFKKSSLVLTLICGLSAIASTHAFADDESNGNIAPAAKRAWELLNKGDLPDSSKAVMPQSSVVIYALPTSKDPGALARLVRAERYHSFLFLYNEFGHGPEVVPYVTAQGAEDDLRALERGESIDVSRCMEKEEKPVSTRDEWLTPVGPYCVFATYNLKMACGTLTRVPLLSAPGLAGYRARDIVATPLTSVVPTCMGGP